MAAKQSKRRTTGDDYGRLTETDWQEVLDDGAWWDAYVDSQKADADAFAAHYDAWVAEQRQAIERAAIGQDVTP